ncbi:uncharacterized protein N7483_007047 [Penicillium malachiteum]|uniref:uncharacterized protein n=1 Tax=Penicillium malachiteum TaxID=1324776 RepID=UPI0025467BF5|nr:uncharacterized protein N7483_007047 [Penicillium malachiteum]KAJ5725690.1 hypothetical protein N7483_007047 [Penicillium malachiteum]
MSSSGGPSDRNGGPSKSFSFAPNSNGAPKKAGFSFQSNRGRPADSPANKGRSLPRRPHRLGHGDDDSDEDEHPPAHEEVSGFDTLTGDALTADGEAVKKEGPLVIPVTSKNNWRDRPGGPKKGKKNLLPAEVQAMQEAERTGKAPAGGEVETEGPSMAYGLSFAQDEQRGSEVADGDQPMADAKPLAPTSAEDKKPLTDDQIALQALIRESKGEVERRSDLVIEASKSRDEEEEESYTHGEPTNSFKTDLKSRPESATLDQYNAIPVEEFGAALLRGMGWKDGQSIGRGNYSSSASAEKANKAAVPARRPGFLGIGAKDSSGGKGAEAELGAWGKSAMRKASRKAGEENSEGKTEGVYMPVMMRNKKTGEYLTEEDLADLKKKSASQPDKDDWRERRDKNLEKSGRDRDREYRKRDYDDEGRSDRKSGSSRRDRSRSSGRQSSRRSRYDEDDDRRRDDRSSRDRERDRDRRRDRDDDKDHRRDRDRDRRHRDDKYSSSSRHSSSHSSRHDRDRDRDRDSRRSRRDD